MNLQFDDISDRAVRVSWSPPKKSNGVLIGYKLKYQIKDNPDSFKEEVLPPSNTSIRVEHLQVRQFKLHIAILRWMGNIRLFSTKRIKLISNFPVNYETCLYASFKYFCLSPIFTLLKSKLGCKFLVQNFLAFFFVKIRKFLVLLNCTALRFFSRD